MASTEARAKWLHYAKRCIVQEEYEGASRPPNSPSSSSESQSEESPGDILADSKRQRKDNVSSFWDPSSPWEAFLTSVEKENYIRIQELDYVEKKSMVEDDPYKVLASENPDKLLSEWIRLEKNEPWWRTADMHDLAPFVSLKSLEHFDNCDLPRAQMKKTEWSDKGLASLTSPSLIVSQYPSVGAGCSPSTACELSKGELLEALCHSQTRAREAEKAAQQAKDEKEHIISLFLRQASHMFAYKQWLHILQLESLWLKYHRHRDPVYSGFPHSLPKRVRKKSPNPSPGIGMFAEFLLGLAFAGAGMLLGWTLGWLFPAHSF